MMLSLTLSYAMPPRIHSERGTVVAADANAGTLVVAFCCDRREFAVRSWTRVRIDGRKIAAAAIAPGTSVRVSYRRLAGVPSLYEVRSTHADVKCTACMACAHQYGGLSYEKVRDNTWPVDRGASTRRRWT